MEDRIESLTQKRSQVRVLFRPLLGAWALFFYGGKRKKDRV